MKRFMHIDFIFLLLFMGACSGTVAHQADPDPESSTSSITVGNPALNFDVAGQVFLTLGNARDNFKKISEDGLLSVLTFTHVANALEQPIVPGIKRFALGPQQEVVAELNEGLKWQNGLCRLFYIKDKSAWCIEESSFDVQSDFHFDQAGNIYYYGYNDEIKTKELVRWKFTTQKRSSLINESLDLLQWDVHADGTIYMVGETSGQNFFRSISSTGIVKNLLANDASVTQFTFIDESHLIFQSESIEHEGLYKSGNFLMTLQGADVGGIIELDLAKGDLQASQRAEDGRIYIAYENSIYSLYPGLVHKIDTGLAELAFFKVFGRKLYAVGQKGLNQVLVEIDLDDPKAEAHTLLEGVEVYHLVAHLDVLYYDGLDFGYNQLVVGKLDITSDVVKKIEVVSERLVQLQAVQSNMNGSFFAVTPQLESAYTIVDSSPEPLPVESDGVIVNVTTIAAPCTVDSVLHNFIRLTLTCDHQLQARHIQTGVNYSFISSQSLGIGKIERLFVINHKLYVYGTGPQGTYKKIVVAEQYVNEGNALIFSVPNDSLIFDHHKSLVAQKQGFIYLISPLGEVVMIDTSQIGGLSVVAKLDLFFGTGDITRVFLEDEFMFVTVSPDLASFNQKTRVLVIDASEIDHPKHVYSFEIDFTPTVIKNSDDGYSFIGLNSEGELCQVDLASDFW